MSKERAWPEERPGCTAERPLERLNGEAPRAKGNLCSFSAAVGRRSARAIGTAEPGGDGDAPDSLLGPLDGRVGVSETEQS